jgi:hypothetical protein
MTYKTELAVNTRETSAVNDYAGSTSLHNTNVGYADHVPLHKINPLSTRAVVRG